MVKKRVEPALTDRIALFDESRFFVWVLFCQTNDVMVRAGDRELRRYNITHEYAATLVLVDFLGEQASPVEISRRRFRQSHTVSTVLVNMEKDGLILKSHDLLRRNQVRVTLTESGRQALQDSLIFDSINRIFGTLASEEKAQMTGFLQRLQRRAIAEFDDRHQERPSKEELLARQSSVNLFRLLRRTSDIMVRVREKELARHNLSIKTASALRVIDMLGNDATPAAIARWRFRHANSVSNQLIRMERIGLVSKTPDSKKKNQVRIRLTESGRLALAKSLERVSIRRMFTDLTDDEVKQFAVYLEELKIMALREPDERE